MQLAFWRKWLVSTSLRSHENTGEYTEEPTDESTCERSGNRWRSATTTIRASTQLLSGGVDWGLPVSDGEQIQADTSGGELMFPPRNCMF